MMNNCIYLLLAFILLSCRFSFYSRINIWIGKSLGKLILDEHVECSDMARKLLEDLLHKYDKRVRDDCFLKRVNDQIEVRPVFNATETLDVAISLTVSQLIDVDEKNQIMTTKVWLKHVRLILLIILSIIKISLKEWRDYRLAWNPAMYDQICIMYIPSQELWLPDIALVCRQISSKKICLEFIV